MKKVTHNQQVLGSSPSWATLKMKHLHFCRCFVFLVKYNISTTNLGSVPKLVFKQKCFVV